MSLLRCPRIARSSFANTARAVAGARKASSRSQSLTTRSITSTIMMAQLLRQLSRPSNAPSQHASQPDGRSAEAVFDAAAERFGRPREPAVVDALAASGVEHAQQLAELSEGDWERLGVSLGLKTAVKAELADPSQLPTLLKHDVTDKKIRQIYRKRGDANIIPNVRFTHLFQCSARH